MPTTPTKKHSTAMAGGISLGTENLKDMKGTRKFVSAVKCDIVTQFEVDARGRLTYRGADQL